MEGPPKNELGRYMVLAQLGTEMVAPIVVGLLLDYQFETLPWLTVTGAVSGFVLGMVHLIYVVSRQNGNTTSAK